MILALLLLTATLAHAIVGTMIKAVTYTVDPSAKFIVVRGERVLIETIEAMIHKSDVAPMNI